MSARIRLLGEPGIEVGDARRDLPGHKTWGLLAFLVLGRRASRREIAELLWPNADDPLAAERWALLQVRRALAGVATIEEAHGHLALAAEPTTRIDASVLLAGAASPQEAADLARGELLAGTFFDDAPGFEQWLTLERQRLLSAQSDGLRHAALSLARSDPESALRLLERAVSLDPFDDALHELAVDIHVSRGDRRMAQTYAEAVERRYRSELGAPPSDTLRRPLLRPAPTSTNPLVDLRVASRALLDAARARLDAGDYAGALDAARRATNDAAASGDGALEAIALTTLASVLIHSVRGHDDEAVGLLERALRLADSDHARAEIERELGYVSFLAADYGAAESALRRAADRAAKAGDRGEVGRALTLMGACESDRADFGRAAATLGSARSLLEAAGDRRWAAFATSFLARAHLRSGHTLEARRLGERSVAGARESGWMSLVPWCMVQEAEAALHAGDPRAAQERFAQAFALGCEIGDPCWESMALRGLALLEASTGRRERAREMLAEAHARCTRASDTYRWADAVLLTDLVELEGGAELSHVEAALRLARRGPMADLAQRLLPFTDQTRVQTART